jgi:integrase
VLRAHFGDLRLRQYTPAMARAFLSSMKTTRTETNLRNIRAVASSIFTEAIDANLLEGIELNPWHIKLPTAMKAGATKVYTREEAENIISALVDHVECQLVMALSCFTGLRHGEIRGLQWGDIDKEWIHIRRQVDDLGNITTPKTTSSVGKVPLLDAVRVPLGLWRKKSADGKMLWVLSKTDRPINLKNLINRVIKPTLEAAQGCALESGDTHLASTLKWKTMHAGRRGAGAMAIAAGNPKLGQMLLRHDKLTTTLKAYDDVMPESDFLAQMQVVHAKQLKS